MRKIRLEIEEMLSRTWPMDIECDNSWNWEKINFTLRKAENKSLDIDDLINNLQKCGIKTIKHTGNDLNHLEAKGLRIWDYVKIEEDE